MGGVSSARRGKGGISFFIGTTPRAYLDNHFLAHWTEDIEGQGAFSQRSVTMLN